MPELAEVEWYRKKWNPGIGDEVTSVDLHAEKRVFRGTDTAALKRHLTGQKLLRSEARGKRMVFQFSGDAWLGIHLGMTGQFTAAHNLPFLSTPNQIYDSENDYPNAIDKMPI